MKNYRYMYLRVSGSISGAGCGILGGSGAPGFGFSCGIIVGGCSGFISGPGTFFLGVISG